MLIRLLRPIRGRSLVEGNPHRPKRKVRVEV